MNRRQRLEARQHKRSVIVASISTLLVLVALYTLVPLAQGWAGVKASFFDWDILVKSFHFLRWFKGG